jgi:cytohesin
MHGNLDASSFCLAHGEGIDARDEDDNTPLHLAAWAGHLEACHKLACSNTVAAARRDGKTPLDLAEEGGSAEVVAFLQCWVPDSGV